MQAETAWEAQASHAADPAGPEAYRSAPSSIGGTMQQAHHGYHGQHAHAQPTIQGPPGSAADAMHRPSWHEPGAMACQVPPGQPAQQHSRQQLGALSHEGRDVDRLSPAAITPAAMPMDQERVVLHFDVDCFYAQVCWRHEQASAWHAAGHG